VSLRFARITYVKRGAPSSKPLFQAIDRGAYFRVILMSCREGRRDELSTPDGLGFPFRAKHLALLHKMVHRDSGAEPSIESGEQLPQLLLEKQLRPGVAGIGGKSSSPQPS
jgi:hypothetical protein